jgi:hypothetical protein
LEVHEHGSQLGAVGDLIGDLLAHGPPQFGGAAEPLSGLDEIERVAPTPTPRAPPAPATMDHTAGAAHFTLSGEGDLGFQETRDKVTADAE